jgi:hypothetical protein
MRAVPEDPAERSQRKQDLLMASQLLRLQADQSLGVIGDKADGIARRAQQVQAFVRQPAVMYGTGLVSLAWLLRPRRRRGRVAGPARRGRLIRYGFFAWRLWRALGPTVLRQLAQHRRR